MLATLLYWWLFDGDGFNMLVVELLWPFENQSPLVTHHIFNLSPTKYIIIYGHQHQCWSHEKTTTALKITSFSALFLFSTCQGLLDAIVDTLEGVDMSRSYCKCGEKQFWSDWSDCNKSCGTGIQSKTRICYRRGEYRCRFDKEREYVWRQDCNTHACRKYKIVHQSADSISASWSQWTDESPCSVSCGGASQTHKRVCEYNGGTSTECPGLDTKIIQCNSQACREYR